LAIIVGGHSLIFKHDIYFILHCLWYRDMW